VPSINLSASRSVGRIDLEAVLKEARKLFEPRGEVVFGVTRLALATMAAIETDRPASLYDRARHAPRRRLDD
jgi:hypothetical protein